MWKRNVLLPLTCMGTARSYKVLSFVTILALFFACALPGESQIFKANPTLYESGGNSAQAIAVADVNKDGKPDLIVANSGTGVGGIVGVLLGNGDGTFQTAVTYAVHSGVDAVAVADLNGDGWPDLVVGISDGAGVTSLSVLLNKGDGTFEAAVGYPAGIDISSVAIADVDGDGIQDVIALDQADKTFTHSAIAVLLGTGGGSLGAAVTYELTNGGTNALSLAVADLNGDGKPDLVVTDDDGKGDGVLYVLLNSGDGTFPSQIAYPTGAFGNSVILGDVNRDGKLDAVVTCPSGSISVLFGNGKGAFGTAAVYPTGFTDSLSSVAMSVAMGDFNGDGAPDLAVASGYQTNTPNGKVAVLLNNGHGIFGTPIVYDTGGRNAVSVAVAKLNQDGKPDMVVADGCDGYNSSCPLGGGVAVFLGVAATTTTKVTTSGTPSQTGQPVTFTAAITATEGPIRNGATVTFYNNGTRIGTAKTTNGAAKFTTSSLAVGTHTIKASYPGSAYFKASSGTITQVVN